MMKRLAVTALVLLAAVGCSGGADGDEWARLRGELVVQGISSDSSRCVIAELESAGIAAEDLTTAASPQALASGQAAYDTATAKCFTDDEVGAIIESEIEEILPEVAAALGITVEETRCIVDGFESQGLSFADVAGGAGDPAVAEAMAALMPQCTGADTPATTEPSPVEPAGDAAAEPPAPDAATADEPATEPVDPAASAPAADGSVYDTAEFRDILIQGIAGGTGQSTEIATCILDTTLAQGFTIDDFVLRGGDEDVVAAITAAGTVCIGE